MVKNKLQELRPHFFIKIDKHTDLNSMKHLFSQKKSPVSCGKEIKLFRLVANYLSLIGLCFRRNLFIKVIMLSLFVGVATLIIAFNIIS
jgi:hypothetical protein